MKKTVDLQPYLEYFKMLTEYEKAGYLEMQHAKHEAFVSQPGLHAMSSGDDPSLQVMESIPLTAKALRAYAAWKSQEGTAYTEKPFAVHVVKDEKPHDLLYTLLLTRRRTWKYLWLRKERIEVISYSDKEG